MGVTVVSSANNLGIQGKASGTDGSVESGGGSDFAALLTQLSVLQPMSLQLQPLAALPSQAGANDQSAEPGEATSAETPLDLNALFAAAGLEGFLANAKPSQAARDDADQHTTDDKGNREAIAGIAGRFDLNPDRNQAPGQIKTATEENPVNALTGNTPQIDTANLAVEAESGSGNRIDFSNTLLSHTTVTQQVPRQHENTPATIGVSTPIHDSRWTQDFGEKIVWLAKSDQQVAQMNLNPPQLGPMHITLNLNGDQASALFISPHAEVRQAIEDAMPHLREMLSSAGINLGQANVGTQLPQQNQGSQPQFSSLSRSGGDNAILRADDEQEVMTPVSTVRSGRGMVDLFA